MAPSAVSPEPAKDLEGRETQVLPVDISELPSDSLSALKKWYEEDPRRGAPITEAAKALRESSVPVAFPTETVYGLGADATRSSAVRGIYKAKQRPSDNPLIVHVASLDQLKRLLHPSHDAAFDSYFEQEPFEPTIDGTPEEYRYFQKLFPPIYGPLIRRFWPGPLTILLPTPQHAPIAPEVTAGLSTFGVRMPSAPLARLLIDVADRPLAAPSANASTKPSPTTAQHVYNDLNGRIDLILDGGPCNVGVESTVVDGLSDPPAILRPGGIGIEEIRKCPGWGKVAIGYEDKAQNATDTPRAPGMKYRHYAPRAKVYLFEAGLTEDDVAKVLVPALTSNIFSQGLPRDRRPVTSFGIVRTHTWAKGLILNAVENGKLVGDGIPDVDYDTYRRNSGEIDQVYEGLDMRRLKIKTGDHQDTNDMWDINLGRDTDHIAKGLFSALRALDDKNVSIIMIEGIQDGEGELAAAVMNRLRKAATVVVR